MFTGIISEIGALVRLRPGGTARLEISAPRTAVGLKPGGSVAVNGACLTAVEVSPGGFAAEAMAETLEKTNLGRLVPGSPVNLESPLKLGGALDGHLVLGHVDGRARLVERRADGVLSLELADAALARYLAPKGSAALDGVSLTVIGAEGRLFTVGLIPHTAKNTTLGGLPPGWELNLEVDVLARYLEGLIGTHKGVDRDFLAEHGFL
ncbi:MAG: riboflavin synthase subunit alpha [Candidatus Coatesbacteria bacterium RBG_13_66_14]|uniref:Riboflavin synthase n=1 Tax=Candidatus Coatesbacteria bacterium RBG_13_66_14 TaxID=1817816 RepID=A0A1F5EW36_9BACT|nr:MAG: riboflavin synthase subunit alpha [Candidatus Coatesbacteria bacterium RBG_13_66_14]